MPQTESVLQSAPSSGSAGDVTGLLQAWRHGDDEAMNSLLPAVYDELKRLARHHMWGEREQHTLQATALIHEAWMRLTDQRSLDWQSRAHFVAMAATMMRRILANHARARNTRKRSAVLIQLDDEAARAPIDQADLLALDRALDKLATFEPELALILEVRWFGGFSVADSARYLACSTATVKRRYRLARSWLRLELGGGAPAVELQAGS